MEESKKTRKKSVRLGKRQRKNVARLIENGMSLADVANRYGVTTPTICKIYWEVTDPDNKRFRRNYDGIMTPEQNAMVSEHERKKSIGWEERLEEIRLAHENYALYRTHWRSQTIDESAVAYPKNHNWVRSWNQDRAGGGARLMNTRIQDEPEIMRPDSDDDRRCRW